MQENADQIIFKVEGRIVGDWAAELERFWKSLEPSLDTKKLCLDISGVTYIDDHGKKILRKIFASTGAVILADSPLTKQFANEARRHGSRSRKTGDGTCIAHTELL